MPIPGFFEGTGMPDPGWWEALWPDPAKVLADVGIEPEMSVVDLCCGDGWFTYPLSRIAREVIAIDIDGALLNAAKVRIAERGGAQNITFVEADAYEMAKAIRAPVDHVFLANAFHGVPDKPRLARAVHDVLKPGGLFAIVSWHARPREETTVLGAPRGPATSLRMTPSQTIAAVEPGGLTFQKQVEVSPYHYGAVFQRPPG
ncbi:class I SAM-dependent methyltransferase [Pseudorhodoplanes sinuspersici]|uniref:Methyltransferase n=1 Tax=Pseudorhodoplanes sinuspersici TaxID=1235591 RepID=A0A1W6ZY77_9HYPH|nr:class I SAM-dependent methyltransferase [Pseudorhodoplanes sinuspersici]ARQ02266.1 methyltransferase [Pseudorhodoplanes sinuspersici]